MRTWPRPLASLAVRSRPSELPSGTAVVSGVWPSEGPAVSLTATVKRETVPGAPAGASAWLADGELSVAET